MSALRVLIKNPVKKNFYGKKINILTTFFIFHKSDVKTFLNLDNLNLNKFILIIKKKSKVTDNSNKVVTVIVSLSNHFTQTT